MTVDNKYRVLIVDDEPWVLDGLQEFIPWNECGFEVCGCAEDGAAALLEVEQLKPDLVLTDINMPGLNGLEFMKRVRKLTNKDVLFLVLSGYNRFDYMSDAMSYGIIDYLLKPLYPQDILPALKKAADQLDRMSRENQKRARDLSELTQDDFNVLTCLDHVENETRERFARAIGVGQDDLIIPILLKFHPAPAGGTDQAALAAEIASCFPSLEGHPVFGVDRHQWAFFAAECADDAERAAEKLLKVLLKKGLPISNIGVGDASTIRNGLPASFQQVRLVQQLTDEPLSLCSRAAGASDSFEDFRRIEEALKAFGNGETARMKSCIHLLFEDCRRKRYSGWRMMNDVRVLNSEIDLLLQEMGISEPAGGPDLMNDPEELSADELEKQVLRYCEERMEQLQNKDSTDGKHIVNAVQRYIPGHLQEPLTLSALAEMFHISPVYLGKLLKRYTGHSLATNVNKSRIEASKVLLRNTALSVQQIAKEVGFQDTSYFTRKFKEQENLLPSDYRRV